MRLKKHAIILAALLLGLVQNHAAAQDFNDGTLKIARTMGLIDAFYVDSVSTDMLAEKAVIEILKNLDPHSTYISAKDVKEMNEPLNGNFEGIGVQFNLLRDSIIVIEPIAGGPSEKVGIRAGDRILTINSEKVTGISITTSGVRSRLMGPKGTVVNVTVFRKGEKDILEFKIIRDKIPLNSLDAAYMLNDETGYIKLNKFAATTEKEFMDAVARLRGSSMKDLVLDLRGNGGGYMVAATNIADKFFSNKNLLVFLKGRKTPRQDYNSTGNGLLASTRLVILTDENSASASEILSGAIQDWDRGVIIGRRSFGKGLVQNGFYMSDGSMIRLTIARYYTPSGRSIQCPYKDGYEKYYQSFVKRYTDGEMMSADSIHFPDSLKYTTLVNKRTVYGGGGIMPDVFVAMDTSYNSQYFRKLAGKNIINTFVLDYYDKNRKTLAAGFKSFEDFMGKFSFSDDDIKSFIAKGETEGVKYNDADFKVSRDEILLVMKGLVASNMWQLNEYFRVINSKDRVIDDALAVLADRKRYDKILGKQ
jgi:carboxyl-terminal processing protease